MKKVFFIGGILLTLVGLALIQPQEELSDQVRIGVSDDMSGFVLDYMVGDGKNQGLEAYFIKDCWAKTTQWALGSDLLDMALICKEAAQTFLENSEGFELVGGAVLNSDIFVIAGDGDQVRKVGMTQDRDYQKDLIRARFGDEVEVEALMASALPYSLANGNLDAIIVDLTKGIHVDGSKEATAWEEDYTSYVLVVKEDFRASRDYQVFVRAYNQALGQLLEDDRLMEKHFLNYTGKELEEGGLDKWRTRLVYLRED